MCLIKQFATSNMELNGNFCNESHSTSHNLVTSKNHLECQRKVNDAAFCHISLLEIHIEFSFFTATTDCCTKLHVITPHTGQINRFVLYLDDLTQTAIQKPAVKKLKQAKQ